MAEISVPDQELIVDKSWELASPAQQNVSSWTGHSKITGLPGAETWKASARIRFRTTLAMQKPWRAFFLALRGIQNTFQLRAACQQRSGSNPTVAAGANAGYTLPLSGLTVSTTNLKAGDYMTVPLPSGHKRLVCLTADLVANGSGNATAAFVPALGEVPNTGATVETVNPYALMRLAEPRYGYSGGNFAFEAVEAL